MSRSKAFGVIVSVVMLGGLAFLSSLPYTPEDPDQAIVRLAWRFPAPALERCRATTPDERAAVPLHMQRDSVCDGRVPPYRLRVGLDGRTVEDSPVSGAGVRGDRPMFVFRDLSVRPGDHEVDVTFAPTGSGVGDAAGLSFSALLTLTAGEIALITYDEASARLVRRTDVSIR